MRNVIILAVEADARISSALKNYLDNVDICHVDYGIPVSKCALEESNEWFAIILLSSSAVSTARFRLAWKEIVFAGYKQYIIKVDHGPLSLLPKEFFGLYYYNLQEHTFDLIADAVQDGTPLQQTGTPIEIVQDRVTDGNNISQQKSFGIQQLRRAWAKISHYCERNDAYYDQHAFAQYEQHLEANLLVLERQLHTQEFRPTSLISVEIPKTTDQTKAKRTLYQAQPETALVLQAICDKISPEFEKDFIDQSFGNRLIVNRREETIEIFRDYWEQYTLFRRNVMNFAFQHPDFFYHRIDITQYYPRINMTNLADLLRDRIADPLVLQIVQQHLAGKVITEAGTEASLGECGLPAGIPLSHLLANFYLHPLDELMRSWTRLPDDTYGYFRYVDDVVFFGENEQKVEEYRDIFERRLRGLLVLPDGEESPLNAEKSTRTALRASDQPILVSKLQGISGLLRQSTYPTLTEKEQEETANTIYQLLFEGSDSPHAAEELARYTPIAIRRLLALRYDLNEIVQLVLAILQKVPLPSHNIKYLVGILVEFYRSNASPDFIDFLKKNSTIVSITVLQKLREHEHEDVDNRLWKWVFERLQIGENIILSREAALTAINAPLQFHAELHFPSLYSESHDFARAYLIEYGAKIHPDTIDVLLVSAFGSDSLMARQSALRVYSGIRGDVSYDTDHVPTEDLDSETTTRVAFILLKQALKERLFGQIDTDMNHEF